MKDQSSNQRYQHQFRQQWRLQRVHHGTSLLQWYHPERKCHLGLWRTKGDFGSYFFPMAGWA